MTTASKNCVCGFRPPEECNPDCERCGLIKEIASLKAANIREQEVRANAYMEICRLESELDAVIQAFPCRINGEPERWIQPSASHGEREYQVVHVSGRWQGFPTKAEAVRAFCNIDAPAKGEGSDAPPTP